MTGWRLESIGRDDPVPTSGIETANEPGEPDELTADNFSVAPAPRPEKKPGSRLTPVIILIVVIGLFAASAWYVFQRFSAPGSADVPVIRADRTPVTQEPEDPGGLTIPNQDSVLLERGEVDEAVVSGETGSSAEETVPISDIPLNIDSSSDVADLSEAGEQATDAIATTIADAADGAADAVQDVEDAAGAASQAANDVTAELAEQGGPSEGISAGSVDVSELAEPEAVGDLLTDAGETAEQVTETAEAVTDGPVVLIERQQTADADGANDAATPVEDVLSLEGSEDLADALETESPQLAELAEDAANQVAEPQVIAPGDSTGGAQIITIPSETESAEAGVAGDAADAASATTETPAETDVAEAPAGEAPAAQAPVAEEEIPAVADEQAAETAETETAALPAADATPAIAPVESGGFRVQMSSVQSRESAQQSWSALKEAHPDLLGALTLTVQQAEVRGSTYYRVQVGPLDQGGAVQLCEQLKVRGQDCLLVRP